MCSNVGIINQGKMILQGEMGDVIFSIDSSNPILITVYSHMNEALALLRKHPLVSRISIDKNTISIIFSGSKEEEALLIKELMDADVLITSFAREHNSLESVFFHLIEPDNERTKKKEGVKA
jgi:ABC-2 type transport system ATP-binding protein